MHRPFRPSCSAGRVTLGAGQNLQDSRLFRALRHRSEARRLAALQRKAFLDETGRQLDSVHDEVWGRWDEIVSHDNEELEND